jgi:hypothetical protein
MRSTPSRIPSRFPSGGLCFGSAILVVAVLCTSASALDESPPAVSSVAPPAPSQGPVLEPLPPEYTPAAPPLPSAPSTEFPTTTPLPESTTDFWPQWRGPLLNGASPNGNPPLVWSEEKNIRWKKVIAGSGSASPVIWGNKVFILTAIDTGVGPPGAEAAKKPTPPRRGPFGPGLRFRPFGGKEGGRLFSSVPSIPREVYQFVVMCLDRSTGETLWQHVATE